MIITERTKRAIPFKPQDAKRIGEGCYYLDQIVWLNGEHIELDGGVGFNFGCYVNGFGGLVIGEGTIVGPYTMIHTANHRTEDVNRPIPEPARDAVAEALRREGIASAVYYRRPLHLTTAYAAYPVAPGGLPVTERLAPTVLSLPMSPYLTPADQDRVVGVVRASAAPT